MEYGLLIRNGATGSTDEAEIVEESILHAKQAVSLDIKDGQSWCTILFQPLSSICNCCS